MNRCADCRTHTVPLQWSRFWEVWLCWPCKEDRIRHYFGATHES